VGTRTPPQRRWWRRKAIVIPVVLSTVAVIAAAIVITGHLLRPKHAAPPTQTTLPFTSPATFGVDHLAVDAADNVYLTVRACPACGTDWLRKGHVLKLSAGSSAPVELPVTGLVTPGAVAVDAAGNLYIADGDWNTGDVNARKYRVLKLAAGSSTPTVVPFTGLRAVEGLAVDSAGNLYVADFGMWEPDPGNAARVVKLAAGSGVQTELPFTGLVGLSTGVAVDAAGNVYVTDPINKRVLKLAAGSSTQTVLPFAGLSSPQGVAADAAGNVYVTDPNNKRVLKLPAASNTSTVLPFTGLRNAMAVAVDAAGGNLYVNDGRVMRLSAG
jgi:serine/threonine protein kinase, bacterial